MWLQLKCIRSTFRDHGNKIILPPLLAVIIRQHSPHPWSETQISTECMHANTLIVQNKAIWQWIKVELYMCILSLSCRWGYQKIESCLCVRHSSGILCFQRGWKRCGDTMCCNTGWYVWAPHIHINTVMKRFHERRVWWQYPFCSLWDLGLMFSELRTLEQDLPRKRS